MEAQCTFQTLDSPRSKLKIQPASAMYREMKIICLVVRWEDAEVAITGCPSSATEYSFISAVGDVSALTSDMMTLG